MDAIIHQGHIYKAGQFVKIGPDPVQCTKEILRIRDGKIKLYSMGQAYEMEVTEFKRQIDLGRVRPDRPTQATLAARDEEQAQFWAIILKAIEAGEMSELEAEEFYLEFCAKQDGN